MGQDIIDQCRGVKDVNLCTEPPCSESQIRTFQHFYYTKEIKVIALTTYTRKKGLYTYPRPVPLSNSIWYAKTIGLLGQTTNFLAEVIFQV